jgi:hypothetical protein
VYFSLNNIMLSMAMFCPTLVSKGNIGEYKS